MICGYCYASAQPDGPSMPEDLAIGALEWFINQLPGERIRITFHGGGEPTMEVKTIKSVVERTEQLRGTRPATYLITTNGTAPEAFTRWMMDHRFGISVSMDGPPDIQDRNRPMVDGRRSSDVVGATVQLLVSENYPFTIRATFSPVDDIERIIRYFGCLGVKKLHLEPLFPHGRDYQLVQFGKRSQYEVYSPAAGELLQQFLRALDVSREYGMTIYNGHLIHFTKGIGYFCGAASGRSMMVTHDGLLTGCLEVVDGNDPTIRTFGNGRWTPEERRFDVDLSKIRTFQSRHADVLPECRTCFARYTCAGGCSVKAVRATGDFMDRDLPYCGFTRGIVPILVRRIAAASGV